MPCARAIPCMHRQQLTAPEQCVTYVQEWKQLKYLVITDCSDMERKREGTAGDLAQLQIHLFPPPYRKAETT